MVGRGRVQRRPEGGRVLAQKPLFPPLPPDPRTGLRGRGRLPHLPRQLGPAAHLEEGKRAVLGRSQGQVHVAVAEAGEQGPAAQIHRRGSPGQVGVQPLSQPHVGDSVAAGEQGPAPLQGRAGHRVDGPACEEQRCGCRGALAPVVRCRPGRAHRSRGPARNSGLSRATPCRGTTGWPCSSNSVPSGQVKSGSMRR